MWDWYLSLGFCQRKRNCLSISEISSMAYQTIALLSVSETVGNFRILQYVGDESCAYAWHSPSNYTRLVTWRIKPTQWSVSSISPFNRAKNSTQKKNIYKIIFFFLSLFLKKGENLGSKFQRYDMNHQSSLFDCKRAMPGHKTKDGANDRQESEMWIRGGKLRLVLIETLRSSIGSVWTAIASVSLVNSFIVMTSVMQMSWSSFQLGGMIYRGAHWHTRHSDATLTTQSNTTKPLTTCLTILCIQTLWILHSTHTRRRTSQISVNQSPSSKNRPRIARESAENRWRSPGTWANQIQEICIQSPTST